MGSVRMTGLISGMDTESIIKELVNAQKLKNKKVSDKLTTSEWKEEKWKELNAKLYKLYTDDLSKLRLQSSYMSKSISSSNSSLATVTGDSKAPDGAHTISISQLASSQYVTGGQLGTDLNGKAVTTSTKLVDLGMAGSSGKDTVITFTNGTNEKKLIVTSSTTLEDFINSCKEVGVSASYDKTQKRLFINSKASGASNAFSITTGEISSTATTALSDVKSLVDYASIGSKGQTATNNAIKALEGTSQADLITLYIKAENNTVGTDAAEQKKIDALKTLREYAITKAEADVKKDSVKQVKDSIKSDLISESGDPDSDTLDALKLQIQTEIDNGTLPSGTVVEDAAIERYKQNQAVYKDLKEQTEAKIVAGTFTLPEGKSLDEYVDDAYNLYTQADKNSLFTKLVDSKYASNTTYQSEADSIYDTTIDSYKDNILDVMDGALMDRLTTYVTNSTVAGLEDGITSKLTKLGLDEISGEKTTSPSGMSVVEAADSKITLDGAEFTATTNTITANGLTITATGTTAVGETISLNVANNTEANYEMVKKFITSYNTILAEMNNLYYADSARDYDPLTDDEKESMSDDQIEKWESKIKGSLLRRDTKLGSLLDAMKTSMSSSVTVGNKKYNLATFGIQTSTDYSEKGLLHIYGDSADSTYSNENDRLKKALAEDPDTTIEALSGMFKNLYDTMATKMKSIPNVSSAMTFYNDKLMDKEQTEYKKRISILEDKLTDMENKYYKQFSAMETAMAKLQSQSSALAGLLGTSSGQ